MVGRLVSVDGVVTDRRDLEDRVVRLECILEQVNSELCESAADARAVSRT